jgi:hypothetical protein
LVAPKTTTPTPTYTPTYITPDWNVLGTGSAGSQYEQATAEINKPKTPSTQPVAKPTILPSWAPQGSQFIKSDDGEWVIKSPDGKYYDLTGQEVDIDDSYRLTYDEATGTWWAPSADEYGNVNPYGKQATLPKQTNPTHQEIQIINGKAVPVTIDDATGQIVEYGTSYGDVPTPSTTTTGIDPRTGLPVQGKYTIAADGTPVWDYESLVSTAPGGAATGIDPTTGNKGQGEWTVTSDGTPIWKPESFTSTEPVHTEIRDINGRLMEVTVRDSDGKALDYGDDYGPATKNIPLPEGASPTMSRGGINYGWNTETGAYDLPQGEVSGYIDPSVKAQLDAEAAQWAAEHPNLGTVGSWLSSGGQEPSRADYDAWPADRKSAYANSIAMGAISPPFWWNARGSSAGQTYSRAPSWMGTGFRQY